MEELKLEKGVPADLSGRIEKEIKTYKRLQALHIDFERVDHEAAETMEICRHIDETLGCATCKNLLLTNRQCTMFYLLLTPGDKRFKTKDLSAALGVSRLSFADGRFMEELLDITPGSLSPLGLYNDLDRAVNLVIDDELKGQEYIGMHPCINTSTLKIKAEDLLDRILPATKHTYRFVTLPRYEEEEA
ncbi:MAG: prolyl-tRNA synthetase associated domain-containing protein [Clostridia bacterium]|nr:prolyl-tRNA synthetase associated domain-containing protein [Clostridia bacterium]